ncbi:hypothetical protein D9758_002713 [Tetrapyrgos nigripes]|uniref:Uncharacterized protein n=1 Tax=Tetrapyrgos nigripes TaxID=182062 RepID=A0A8H5GQQ7_9AGAR|nr:hypothetical protein D9758_002713 [Tetrapyrgos nigripes]
MAMERLCDELLTLIFYELHDPMPFILLSKRFYNFSQDPHTRAHFFLTRHGPAEAMYHALGRGKVVNERVIDILISSGAHLSRYLVQVAIHHYFYTQSHFIKTQWVRTVGLGPFSHLLQLASTRYGEIPRAKGLDDGSVFSSYLKESRYPPSMRQIKWETIREIMETYHFMPFCAKDPLMAQFPLALSIEPRLLPYAVANGFTMDNKYRDFVFRKMFENNPSATDRTANDIVENVKELCRLDASMFLSRTVAAEICMEAKSNEIGYSALKLLDRSGLLLFHLSSLVEDLLKLFLRTRSITSHSTQQNLLHLFTDYPSSDPTVRLVILVIVFLSNDNNHPTIPIKTRLETLKIGPVTRLDLYNVLIHPFVERYSSVFDYMRSDMETSEEGKKGLNQREMRAVVDEVAARLLEFDCKGKMLKKLHDGYTSVRETIIRSVFDKHQLRLEDLPESQDTDACVTYRAPLCYDTGYGSSDMTYFWDKERSITESSRSKDEKKVIPREGASTLELGAIGQETLTNMIRHDELMLPTRSRRRIFYPYVNEFQMFPLPSDYVKVGRWIKNDFGAKSSITAVFMTHAVLNDNDSILRHYLLDPASSPVPVTLKHFKLLARLGRSINYTLFVAIENGSDFYNSEEDYIAEWDTSRRVYNRMKKGRDSSITRGHSRPQVLVGTQSSSSFSVPSSSKSATATTLASSSSTSSATSSSTLNTTANTRGIKRPRRSAAATVQSYIVPDSDDDLIAGDSDTDEDAETEQHVPTEIADRDADVDMDVDVDVDEKIDDRKRVEILNLNKWVWGLEELLKEEQAKNRQIRKQLQLELQLQQEQKEKEEKEIETVKSEEKVETVTQGQAQRVYLGRTDFIRSLSSHLRSLRKTLKQKQGSDTAGVGTHPSTGTSTSASAWAGQRGSGRKRGSGSGSGSRTKTRAVKRRRKNGSGSGSGGTTAASGAGSGGGTTAAASAV